MENNNQKRITFEGDKDPNDVIIEILKNNGFNETLDEYIEKTDKNIEPWFDILYRAGKKLFTEDITDDEFLITVQQKLNTSEEISKRILDEIKKNLFPLARILTKEELEQESSDIGTPDVLPKIKPPIGVAEILEKPRTGMPEKKVIEPPQDEKVVAPAPKRKSRLPRKPVVEESVPEQPKRQKSGPDKYREPIG